MHIAIFPKKAVFTLDLFIFDPLFQTPDAQFHPPKDQLVNLAQPEAWSVERHTVKCQNWFELNCVLDFSKF